MTKKKTEPIGWTHVCTLGAISKLFVDKCSICGRTRPKGKKDK